MDKQARAQQAREALQASGRGIILQHGEIALQRTYGAVRIVQGTARTTMLEIAVNTRTHRAALHAAVAAAWAEITDVAE